MIFTYRLIKHLLGFLCIDLPLQLLGILILYPVCWFYDIGKLPRILRWFDSADPYVGRNTLVIDCINAGKDVKYTFYPSPKSIYQVVFNKYHWLSMRNPLNYYGYLRKGLKFEQPIKYIKHNKEEDTVGDSTGDHPGFRHIEVDVAGKRYYEYYYIYKYNKEKCLRFRMGWKISDNNNPLGTIAQQVLVLQPYKSYSGV